ncbi:hypothetical protein [Lentibacillus sediminis]|uniref:hypothetical protein n=1 Tax=Lentibacillus sediminis TaxID=1940529 RepID=UPI000C1BD774|nr:hypothetical protein [Lentibacillus sediminis]
MKKKWTILAAITLVLGVFLGTISVSAADEETDDIEQHEVNYNSNALVNNEVTPEAIPAFAAGALAGGLLYDAVKGTVTYMHGVYQDAGGHEAVADSYERGTNYLGQSLESTEDENVTAFGR